MRLYLQGDMNLQKDGSRHPSVSDAEENFAVLRRSVKAMLVVLVDHFHLKIHDFFYMTDICRHVMNELLETERAYVEELLCVLEVSS